MSQTSKDEIDLGYLINKISELFKNISVSIYNSIQFCLRNWYFIVGLLIGGIVLGYFSEIDSKPAKKATLILRTNFNTAEYTYNALNTLMVKSKTLDTAFLKQHGFKTEEQRNWRNRNYSYGKFQRYHRKFLAKRTRS